MRRAGKPAFPGTWAFSRATWANCCFCSRTRGRTAVFAPGRRVSVMPAFPGTWAFSRTTWANRCFCSRTRGRTAVSAPGRVGGLLFLPQAEFRVAVSGGGLADLAILCRRSATWLRSKRVGWFRRRPSLSPYRGGGGGGTNPCNVGLDLSGSWQQGHSATYNAPLRFKSSAKDSARRPLGRELRGGPPRRVGRAG